MLTGVQGAASDGGQSRTALRCAAAVRADAVVVIRLGGPPSSGGAALKPVGGEGPFLPLSPREREREGPPAGGILRPQRAAVARHLLCRSSVPSSTRHMGAMS